MINILIKVFIISLIITLLFSMLLCISSNRIFNYNNKNKLYSYIPIYNIIILLDIVKLNKYFIILMFLPITNIILIILILYRLSIIFNTGITYSILLILLPIIFLPLLNYSNKTNIKEEVPKDIILMTDKEINDLNNSVAIENKIDNVFKKEEVIHEDVKPFKSRKTIYNDYFLKEENKISEVKEEKIVNKEEDDNIEIIEL